ncbi:bifunctional metallophosphatase/5'-nucleotidase [Sediminitomix flava]|uniref:5'-nucleotidase n=1 Tax=Sediminitomix flava TaxID=379075 RepID=A0A315Z785_SEDFL|nr:metallophosphatase [Sediminitomix flava]PWJ39275.1 5'-nucleotidase [Sediminitomix flava]
MERRQFIKNILGATALASLTPLPSLLAADGSKKLCILHTNDVHSHIDPFPADHPKYAGLGGFARRASLIKQIREQEDNILLLDAGDVFQGTPYFNMFGGELEYKLMSQMGYDAGTIGNHEFDNGLEGLKKQLPNANFEILNANYDFSNTTLEGQFKPYKIFNKKGIKVGVFAVGISLDGLVDKKMYKETKYNDALDVSQEYAKKLKEEEGCHLVICLSHVGYNYRNPEIVSDTKIAANSEHIDLIIGGHTHTFLTTPDKVKNKNGKEVMIVQTGWAGINLGRVDINFDQRLGVKEINGGYSSIC